MAYGVVSSYGVVADAGVRPSYGVAPDYGTGDDAGLDAALSTFTSADYTPPADGTTPTTLTFTARDADNTLVADEAVTFTVLSRRTVSAALSTMDGDATGLDDGSTPANVEAFIRDTDGNPVIGAPVTLASSRGATDTITAVDAITNENGRFRWTVVSSTAGSPVFTATCFGQAVTETQTVVFGAGGSLTPNLPEGMTPFLTITWDDPDFISNGWGPSVLNEGNTTTTIIADPTGSVPEGTNVGRMFFPENMGAGFGPQWRSPDVDASGYTRFYVAYRLYLTANYVIHTGDEKFHWPDLRVRESPAEYRPAGHLYLADNEARDDDGPTDPIASVGIWRDPFASPAPPLVYGAVDGPTIPKGQWCTIEYLVEIQTGTGGTQAADAVMRAWIDGALAAELTGVSLNERAGEQGYGQSVLRWLGIYGIRGGGASSVPIPPEGQSRYYGRILMYGGT